MRKGYIYVGGILLLFGLVFLAVGAAPGSQENYTRDPITGIWTEEGGGRSFIQVGLGAGGEMVAVFGGLCALYGCFAKPSSYLSDDEDAKRLLRKWGLAAFGLMGGMMFLAILIYAMTSDPSVLAIVAALFFAYVLLAPLAKTILGYLGFVYAASRPQSNTSKLLTALLSVMFGVGVLVLMAEASGGFLGLFVPIFLNPIGGIISIIVGVLLMLFASIVILAVKKRFA